MRIQGWQRGLIIGLLLVGAFGAASLIWGLLGKARVAMSEAHDAKWQYEELEKRRLSLETNLALLDTSRGQDAAIRTAFGVARPGEEVIVVVPPAVATTTQPLSWWQRILGWF